MGLFKRNTEAAPARERCPECREWVPQGQETCTMCGFDLHAFRASPDAQGGAIPPLGSLRSPTR